jgi:phage portal protein BeeE
MTRTRVLRVAVSDAGRTIGEDHPRSKLTNAEVEEIRDLLESGAVGTRRVAREYGVSRALVRQIRDYSRRRQVMMAVRVMVVEGKVTRVRRVSQS